MLLDITNLPVTSVITTFANSVFGDVMFKVNTSLNGFGHSHHHFRNDIFLICGITRPVCNYANSALFISFIFVSSLSIDALDCPGNGFCCIIDVTVTPPCLYH